MLIYQCEAVELIKPVLNVNYSIGIIGCSLHTVIKDVRLMKEKKIKTQLYMFTELGFGCLTLPTAADRFDLITAT